MFYHNFEIMSTMRDWYLQLDNLKTDQCIVRLYQYIKANQDFFLYATNDPNLMSHDSDVLYYGVPEFEEDNERKLNGFISDYEAIEIEISQFYGTWVCEYDDSHYINFYQNLDGDYFCDLIRDYGEITPFTYYEYNKDNILKYLSF